MAGALAVTAIAYALITGSFALALVFIALVAVFVLFRDLPYHRYKVQITENGFQLDNKTYGWGNLKAFWILQGEHFNELHISTKKGRELRVLLEQGDPYAVRDTLLAFIPQDGEQHERLLDYIIRFCKL